MKGNNLSTIIGRDPTPLLLARNLAFILVALAALTELLGRTGLLPFGISMPSSIVSTLWELVSEGERSNAARASSWIYLGDHILVSFKHATGVFAGAPLGLAVAMILAVFPPLRYFAWVSVGIAFGAPTIAFFLIAVPVVGSIELVIWLTSAWVGYSLVLVYIYTHLDQIVRRKSKNKEANEVFERLEAMKPSRFRLVVRYLIPMLWPQFFSALAVGVIYAWHMLAFSEGFGSGHGVGGMVARGQEGYNEILWGGAFLVACFAMLWYIVLLAIAQIVNRTRSE